MEEMIALNVNALTRLTYAARTGLRRARRWHDHQHRLDRRRRAGNLNGVYGGSKAFVLAFSQSLQHELADKGVRVQAVLPGATATEFWDIAGLPVEHLPTGDRDDGRRHGRRGAGRPRPGRDLVTIPSLPANSPS
jgi:short-subunit dehydrogenase